LTIIILRTSFGTSIRNRIKTRTRVRFRRVVTGPGLGLPDVDGKVAEVPHDGLGLGGLLEQVYWQLRY